MKHEKYNIEPKYKIIKLEDHINSQRMNFVSRFKIFKKKINFFFIRKTTISTSQISPEKASL
jgi:hypothetical protein